MALKWLPCLLLLPLAACGYRGQLTRIEPAGLDREALQAARKQEAERVAARLLPDPEHRPVRVDDISVRLEARQDDPFDLPPE